MAHAMYNPTFKRPNGMPPQRPRSPSPPRAFVEPLSPAKPAPMEPMFSYPAINNNVDFTVRPETSYNSTPRARAYSNNHSTNQRSGHHRTPSIDTLAEAALAVSPSFHGHSRNSSAALGRSEHTHAHPAPHMYGASEPPHKRARSELLPSPFVQQYASRPATSYEVGNHWAYPVQPTPGYNSRVEEAALLLNFQSGGWPGQASSPPNPPPALPRPHANSFPQHGLHQRPAEVLAQQPPALLPPFNPMEVDQAPPASLPSPEHTVIEPGPSPKFQEGSTNDDVEMRDAHMFPPAEKVDEQPQQTQTPPDDTDSRATSTDANVAEKAEAPKKRGWPKGKPRGSGPRKSMAEKAATKRAAARKKTPDAKSSRSKSEGVTSDWADAQEVRRKSLSDASVFDELDSEHRTPQTPRRARSVPLEAFKTIRDRSPSKAPRRKAAVNPEIICAGCQEVRETAKSHPELEEWISCNACKKWFHVDCAGFKKAHEVRDVDKYFCSNCEEEHGKTTYVRKSTRAHASVDYAELQRGVLKTSEESVEHHYIQPIKDGTFQFEPETFPRMRPEMVTREFFEKSGTFVEPICIPAEWNPRPWAKSTGNDTEGEEQREPRCADGDMEDMLPEDFEYDTVPDHGQDKLEMVMPQGLTVRHVCNLVGPDWPIDVIDVKTQNSGAKWNLARWADYYEEEADEKAIRNVISLEVSQTKLGRLLQRPKVVRDIDLQDDVWPQEEIDKGKWPKVQFYCLMSVADSYTDFHIDFGGSSVYYHILKGKKTFFFIPPKPKHLKAYEEWNESPQQNYTFLPTITKECYRVDLSEGDTMLIPSGWIHAVWTPEDSLVIGGNFLTRMSYKNQFKVVEIEKANETPIKFRYPSFQKVMWYTAIKYLRDDPMPPTISEMFYEGKQYHRELPIWADFDGDIAQNDPRPGAHNARYYSQAEIDGLPDLATFIFRTVMLVMGRVEGVTQDRMKRVNASIPKGHGEPLEVAKNFALWVAWKRGNEDPPAWAHPDAVLPNSKEEGPPKKLSEKKLRELERREAYAAYKIAPDRQSARVMSKNAAAMANPENSNSSPSAPQPPNHQMPIPYYQNQAFGSSTGPSDAPPDAFVMSSVSGQHLSTPKTSVLGPKRVACDACRKRRIRCKHKDLVMQTSTTQMGSQVDGAGESQLAPELLHDNINVTTPKQMGFMNTVMDHQPDSANGANGMGFDGDYTPNGTPQVNGHAPQPGTNAYVNANIPMTVNGVAIFGEAPKRGRSKACYECRKSKRRCIHDENGNVDPTKAAETPVPRGSISVKKRPGEEDGSPIQPKKQRPSDGVETFTPPQMPQQPQMQGHGVLKPQPIAKSPSYQPRKSTAQQRRQGPAQPTQPDEDEQPPIDPNLFSMYPEPESHGEYSRSYPYPTTEQTAPQHAYGGLPSLEQIANEVLVDMNGNEYHDPAFGAQQAIQNHAQTFNGTAMSNGVAKQDSSVDSAVSLPTSEILEQATNGLPNGQPQGANLNNEHQHELGPIQQFLEADRAAASAAQSASPPKDKHTSPPRPTSGASNLPLYKPPAPLPSHSPELSKRRPSSSMPNGKSASPTLDTTTPHKRKRDSNSATPGPKSAKAAKVDRVDAESVELAKMLQQEDMGLRRRSK